jgi:hypothetical protein
MLKPLQLILMEMPVKIASIRAYLKTPFDNQIPCLQTLFMQEDAPDINEEG